MGSLSRWNAQDYAKHSSARQDWARELMAGLRLRGHENILELASTAALVRLNRDRINLEYRLGDWA